MARAPDIRSQTDDALAERAKAHAAWLAAVLARRVQVAADPVVAS